MRRALSTAASASAIFLVAWPVITSTGFEQGLKVLGFIYFVATLPLVLLGLGLRNRRAWKGKVQLLLGLLVVADVVLSSAHGKPPVNDEEIAGIGLLEMFGIFILVFAGTLVALMAFDWDRRRFRDCPHCLGRVPVGASRCRFCASDLFPLQVELPEWHWSHWLGRLKAEVRSFRFIKRRSREPRRIPG